MTLSLAKLILIFSIIGAIVSLIKICFNAVSFARAIKEKETKNISLDIISDIFWVVFFLMLVVSMLLD